MEEENSDYLTQGGGGGALLAKLPLGVIRTKILTSGFLEYDDLVRLSWCDTTLRTFVGGILNGMSDELLRFYLKRANKFHDGNKDKGEVGRKSMQALTVAEVFHQEDNAPWAQDLINAQQILSTTTFQPERDEEMEDYPLYCGNTTLCFGFVVDYDELWDHLYIGRRWYTGQKVNEDGSMHLASQTLKETPYEGHGEYTEVDKTRESLSWNVWMGNDLDYGDPRCEAEARPAGLKAWKGPYLKYHMSKALEDYAYRKGIDPSILKHLSVYFTGGAEGGPDVVVGIQIGRDMCASYFDIFHATGRRIFDAGERDRSGYQIPFRHDIKPASREYAAETVGMGIESQAFAAMDDMFAPIAALAKQLRSERVSTTGTGF
ncbi:MAG: hypothetical protein SGILL_009607, partial [Bacillariaceae sp.]